MTEREVSVGFTINDQSKNYPTRTVTAPVSQTALDTLVEAGYLTLPHLVPPDHAAALARAVLQLAMAERDQPGAEHLEGQSIYLRALLDKDLAFHPLLRLEPALSIARLLLGPQVWIDLEARVNFAGRSGVAVPWHGHLPMVPDPVPPLFSFPHQIHCLLYLDQVTDQEGALCLIPGSHRRHDLRFPLGDTTDHAGQVELFFEPGDAVLIHANLWHRTIPSTARAGYRRLLLIGFVPAWIRNDTPHGVPAQHRLTDQPRAAGDDETTELLGDFAW